MLQVLPSISSAEKSMGIVFSSLRVAELVEYYVNVLRYRVVCDFSSLQRSLSRQTLLLVIILARLKMPSIELIPICPKGSFETCYFCEYHSTTIDTAKKNLLWQRIIPKKYPNEHYKLDQISQIYNFKFS